MKYEDLLSDPNRAQVRLFDYLEEAAVGKFSDFNEKSKTATGMAVALNKIRAIDEENIKTWKKHPIRIWSEFTENPNLFDILVDLGYEKDKSWFIEMFKAKLPLGN